MNPQPRPSMVSGVSQQPPLQHLQQPPGPQTPLPQMMMMNPPPPQQQRMMNRGYGMWPPPSGPMDRRQFNFRKPNSIPPKVQGTGGSGYVSGSKPLGPRNNWKGKKSGKGKQFGGRRIDGPVPVGGNNVAISFGNPNIFGSTNIGIGGAYKPPSLNELQHQNKVKTRRFFNKKNFNNNNNNNNNYNRGKFAPRNTSSYIIRAKKSGGITELVSPYPVTPAILPTPIFSPSKEVLVDMAKEEWGVDGYGSMKGLIRLRSPGHEAGEGHEEEESDEGGGGSSDSDVEEHVEVERRLDQDLSRFEMIYPNYGMEHNNVLESRMDDPDSYIAQLEEENLILKERLFLMGSENGDLRRRLQFYERENKGVEDVNEDAETDSENDSDSHGDVQSVEVNREEMFEEVNDADGDAKAQEEGSDRMQVVEAVEKDENIDVGRFINVDQAEFQAVEKKDENFERQFANVDKIEFQAVKKKEENFAKPFADIDKTEAHVVESNECVKDTVSDIQVVVLKENTSYPEVMQERPLGADLSMEDVATLDKPISAEDQCSQEEVSESKGSDKSIVGGD